MARAAVKAKQAQHAQTQATAAKPRRRGHASGGNPNQDLFFSRIRRRQKWVFVLLIVVFAVSFAALGVGSGNGGGLEQMFSGLLGSGSDPVAKAQGEIKTDPLKGYRDLANAYATKSDLPNAIAAMNSYLKLKKTDAQMWTVLGGYQKAQADNSYRQYQQILLSEQIQVPGTAIKPGGVFGKALGTSPIDDFYLRQLQAQATAPYTNAQAGYRDSLASYQNAAKYTKGKLEQAAAWYAVFNAASSAGDKAAALKALQNYVKLNPDTTLLKQIQGICKSLGGSCELHPTKPKK